MTDTPFDVMAVAMRAVSEASEIDTRARRGSTVRISERSTRLLKVLFAHEGAMGRPTTMLGLLDNIVEDHVHSLIRDLNFDADGNALPNDDRGWPYRHVLTQALGAVVADREESEDNGIAT